MLPGDSLVFELETQHCGDVQVRGSVLSFQVSIGTAVLAAELLGDVVAHRVAVGANAGPDEDVELLRDRAVSLTHGLDGLAGDAGERSPPTGVRSGDHPVLPIAEE
jgi:hypothetical protein